MNLDQARILLGQARDLLTKLDGALTDAPTTAIVHKIRVPVGESIQIALDRAPSNTWLQLDAGATYFENVVLPAGKRTMMLTGSIPFPSSTSRVKPGLAAGLPRLLSPSSLPAISAATGARDYLVSGLEIGPTPTGDGDIVVLSGDVADITIDRCYIHGDPTYGQKRGIALNGGAANVFGCYISDCKRKGQDSQAIAGWSGPGPYTIVDCYLEAAGENVIFGGADPTIPDLVPSDIRISRCHLAKPLAWRAEGWQVKNLFELKNARGVVLEDSLLEYSWLHAQVGYAVLLTVRNQDGAAPWSTIEGVVIRNNTIRHCGGAFNILARDYSHPSARMANVTIESNYVEDLDPGQWGGDGRQFLINGGPKGLVIRNNRFDGAQINSFLTFAPGPDLCEGLVVADNSFMEGDYGIFGEVVGLGVVALDRYAPGYTWAANTIVRGSSGRNIAYPPSTTLV